MDFSKEFCYLCINRTENMKIHYNFATRSRPTKMTAAIATIKAYSHKADYTIGITVDDDDDVTLPITGNYNRIRISTSHMVKAIARYTLSTGACMPGKVI
jgi:hypothetical protein